MMLPPVITGSGVPPYLQKAWQFLSSCVNGHISFGTVTSRGNVEGAMLSVTSPSTANTDFTLTHGLGRLPSGFIPVSKSAACDVYLGSAAATTTQITLRATAASVLLVIFVI